MRKATLSGCATALALGAAVVFAGVVTPVKPAAAQCAMWCPCGQGGCPPGSNVFTETFEGFFKAAARGSGAIKADTKKKPAKRSKRKKKG